MLRLRSTHLLSSASLLLLVACGDDAPITDAGTHDAAVASDAGLEVDAGQIADAGSDDPIPERFRPLAEAFEAERSTLGAPGAALLVMEGGEVTFAKGFGTTRPGGSEPVKPSTLFRIGSVTKMLTATALLQEVEAGRLTLDDSLGGAIPGLTFDLGPTWSQDILLRHLISHTAGFVDYLEVGLPPDAQGDEQLESFLTEVFAAEGYLMAPPGAFYNYSNPNFMFAGLVAEKSSGLGYRALMQQRVFAPLGMDRTFFLSSEALADGDYAVGRSTDDDGAPIEVPPDAYENPWARPAGYAFSSVEDLARYVRFVRNGDPAVLSDDLRTQAITPQISTKEAGDRLHYGFGWFVYEGFQDAQGGYLAVPILTHGGAIPGFSADIYWLPTLDLAVITLASTDGAYFRESFEVALSTLVTLPAPTTPPEDLTPRAEDLAQHVGRFVDPFNAGRVNTSQEDGALVVSMPDVDAAGLTYDRVLRPLARHNYLMTIEGQAFGVTFLGDEGQPAQYFRTRPFVAARATSARPSAVSIDPAALRRRLRAAATRQAPLLLLGR